MSSLGQLLSLNDFLRLAIDLLDRLAQEFEVGIRYTERQVNAILLAFHPDFAALRRHMVDEGFLSRADGSYWRTGGRVDVDNE